MCICFKLRKRRKKVLLYRSVLNEFLACIHLLLVSTHNVMVYTKIVLVCFVHLACTNLTVMSACRVVSLIQFHFQYFPTLMAMSSVTVTIPWDMEPQYVQPVKIKKEPIHISICVLGWMTVHCICPWAKVTIANRVMAYTKIMPGSHF